MIQMIIKKIKDFFSKKKPKGFLFIENSKEFSMRKRGKSINSLTIKKKAWPEFFELVKSGKKKFDLRIADFECKEGDTLILEEWDPKTQQYTGRKLTKKVSFVLKTKDLEFFSKEDIEKYGFQVIQLSE